MSPKTIIWAICWAIILALVGAISVTLVGAFVRVVHGEMVDGVRTVVTFGAFVGALG